MSVTLEDVRYIASLARLRFSEDEEVRLAREMNEILAYMEKLNELDTDAIPPMSHVLDLTNVFRTDEVRERVTREEALGLGPDTDGTFFRVPRVIE